MPRIAWRNFSRGLWVNSPKDAVPDGGWPRFRNIDPLSTNSIRSRNGGNSIFVVPSHRGVFLFVGTFFQAGATTLFRSGVPLTAALVGHRLTFAVMQVPFGTDDFLFIAAVGHLVFPAAGILRAQLAKVSRAGAMTRWGITYGGAFTSALLAADGVGNLNGTYSYAYTYLNINTGTRSNPRPRLNEARATVAPVNQSVDINLGTVQPTDPQVTHLEIWRTVGNGTIHFKVMNVAVGVLLQNDNVADANLTSEELPYDNAPPHINFLDAVGPYQGRMWFGRIDSAAPAVGGVGDEVVVGGRGQVHYGPIGRPESAQGGFLLLTSDDDEIQKLVIWNGTLWAFTVRAIYQVVGVDEPFTFRQIEGAPGTLAPFAVAPTPFGIFYVAHDGVRVFDGVASRKIGDEAVSRVFRGEVPEDIPSINSGLGTVAVYARQSYYLSNSANSILALDVATNQWRSIGNVAEVNAPQYLYYDPDGDDIYFGLPLTARQFETPGIFEDDLANIEFEIETPSVRADAAQRGVLQRFYVECDTSGQSLTCNAVVDGVLVPLAAVNTSGRATVEIPLARAGRTFGLRLTGSLDERVEIFGIEADLWVPKPSVPPDGV